MPETREGSEKGFFLDVFRRCCRWGFSCASLALVAPVTASLTDVMALWMRSPMFVNLPFSAVPNNLATRFAPAETIDPRSAAASIVADFLIRLLSRATRVLQYFLVIIPTRSVRKALAVPFKMELVNIEVTVETMAPKPGMAPRIEPEALATMGPTCSRISLSSNSLATKAVNTTFAYN